MGRGAHAAHAAYNGSGTQGISVTNKINDEDEIKSVFYNENDTTKQTLHGCNLSEMKCIGKSDGGGRYKIFTPDDNADMIGDIYFNSEMDSEMSNIKFVDTVTNTEFDLESQTEESRQIKLNVFGSSSGEIDIDLNTGTFPVTKLYNSSGSLVSDLSSDNENSYLNTLGILNINKSLMEDIPSNLGGGTIEIMVGAKNTTNNMAYRIKNNTNSNSIKDTWVPLNVPDLVEIYDVLLYSETFTTGNKKMFIFAGEGQKDNLNLHDLNNHYYYGQYHQHVPDPPYTVQRCLKWILLEDIVNNIPNSFNSITRTSAIKNLIGFTENNKYKVIYSLNLIPGSNTIIASGKITSGYALELIETNDPTTTNDINAASFLKGIFSITSSVNADVLEFDFNFIKHNNFFFPNESPSGTEFNEPGFSSTIENWHYDLTISNITKKNDDVIATADFKTKFLMGLDNNKKVIKSYDNGKTWERCNFPHGAFDENGALISGYVTANDTGRQRMLLQIPVSSVDATILDVKNKLKAIHGSDFDFKILNRTDLTYLADGDIPDDIYLYQGRPSGGVGRGAAGSWPFASGTYIFDRLGDDITRTNSNGDIEIAFQDFVPGGNITESNTSLDSMLTYGGNDYFNRLNVTIYNSDDTTTGFLNTNGTVNINRTGWPEVIYVIVPNISRTEGFGIGTAQEYMTRVPIICQTWNIVNNVWDTIEVSELKNRLYHLTGILVSSQEIYDLDNIELSDTAIVPSSSSSREWVELRLASGGNPSNLHFVSLHIERYSHLSNITNHVDPFPISDEFKFYIPQVDVLVSNNRGSFLAAGKQGTSLFRNKEHIKEYRHFYFISHDQGVSWQPYTFYINNWYGTDEITDINSLKRGYSREYLTYQSPIEFTSGYAESGNSGNIFLTFKIPKSEEGEPVYADKYGDTELLVYEKLGTMSISISQENNEYNLKGAVFPRTQSSLGSDQRQSCLLYEPNLYVFENESISDFITTTKTWADEGYNRFNGVVLSKDVYLIYGYKYIYLFPYSFVPRTDIGGRGDASRTSIKNIPILIGDNKDIKHVSYSDNLLIGIIQNVNTLNYELIGSETGLVWFSITKSNNQTFTCSNFKLSGNSDGNFIMSLEENDSTDVFRYSAQDKNFELILQNKFNSVESISPIKNSWNIFGTKDGENVKLVSYDTFKWINSTYTSYTPPLLVELWLNNAPPASYNSIVPKYIYSTTRWEYDTLLKILPNSTTNTYDDAELYSVYWTKTIPDILELYSFPIANSVGGVRTSLISGQVSLDPVLINPSNQVELIGKTASTSNVTDGIYNSIPDKYMTYNSVSGGEIILSTDKPGSPIVELSEGRNFNATLSNDRNLKFKVSKSYYGTFSNPIYVNEVVNKVHTLSKLTSNNVFALGSISDSTGQHGVLLYKSGPQDKQLSVFDNINPWRVIMGSLPSTTLPNIPISERWMLSNFINIHDIYITRVRGYYEIAIVGDPKPGYGPLSFYDASKNDLDNDINIYNNWVNVNVNNLNFTKLYSVCNDGYYWYVAGVPKQEANVSVIDSDNNKKCVAYATSETLFSSWEYINFENGSIYGDLKPKILRNDGYTDPVDIGDFQGNHIIPTQVSGKTGILLQMSFTYNESNGTYLSGDADRIGFSFNTTFSGRVLNEKVYFIYRSGGNIHVKQNERYPEPWMAFDINAPKTITGVPIRTKQLNRSYTHLINGDIRTVVNSKFPVNFNMYLVSLKSNYTDNDLFELIPFKENNFSLPHIFGIISDNTGVPLTFNRIVEDAKDELLFIIPGECYSVEKVSNENFVIGVDSGRYLAVGKGNNASIAWSNDLFKWNSSNISDIMTIVFDIKHKHGLWVAIGDGNFNIAISKNGKTWKGLYSRYNNNYSLIESSSSNTIEDSYFTTLSVTEQTTNLVDVLPYIPKIEGIFLKNLSILRLFDKIEYYVGTQIWQTLTFDDIKALIDTEVGHGEYLNLLRNTHKIKKLGNTDFSVMIPGFTKSLNSKLETFVNVSESGSFPNGLLDNQKMYVKMYYKKLEEEIGTVVSSAQMNLPDFTFDNLMNNTLIPVPRDNNYYVDSLLGDNYGFQLGDTYKNVNGYFSANFSTDIIRLRMYCKNFELSEPDINKFKLTRELTQITKLTQTLYFETQNKSEIKMNLDNFSLYSSHLILSGWLSTGTYITSMFLELNGYKINNNTSIKLLDYASIYSLGLNYNRYYFNNVDKEDGLGSIVIPLASTAYSGSSIPLDRYDSIKLRVFFNQTAGTNSYLNVTCVGQGTITYDNSVANLNIY